jgi:glutathione synthase/RimK-type ligase-like ATP-grasp enzyme
MFAAFAALGVEAEPVIYSDDRAAAIREQLLDLDAVLVWVNPIEHGLDRSRLDPLLREAARAGVFVSAHPDAIQRLATKRVLVDTAAMSWSAETHLYATHAQLESELPARLAEHGPLVLKQHWGMGGAGVWKVELAAGGARIQHAAAAAPPHDVSVEEFLRRCEPYFSGGGVMIEQPFQPRLAEGMIRVYLCHDAVVGFAHQYPRGLLPPDVGSRLPTEKVFLAPSAGEYQQLRRLLESRWIAELQRLVRVDRRSMPVIWDIDFLYGPKTDGGNDTYVLCEINASSTFAFPEHAMRAVARAALEQVTSGSRRAAR